MEEKKFVASGVFDESLTCCICLDSWDDPVELSCKEHIICRSCAAHVDKCPQCRKPITSLSEPHRLLLNMALAVQVTCLTCGWKGTREHSHQHSCPSLNAPPLALPQTAGTTDDGSGEYLPIQWSQLANNIIVEIEPGHAPGSRITATEVDAGGVLILRKLSTEPDLHKKQLFIAHKVLGAGDGTFVFTSFAQNDRSIDCGGQSRAPCMLWTTRVDSPHQRWELIPRDRSFVSLRCKQLNTMLDVDCASVEDGTMILNWNPRSRTNQQFQFFARAIAAPLPPAPVTRVQAPLAEPPLAEPPADVLTTIPPL